MKNKLLIVNVCREKLHYFEFVKPIEDIARGMADDGIYFETKSYKNIKQGGIKKFGKIIICGTSLKDFEYLHHIKRFSWIKRYKGSILGICAGMQIICDIYRCKLEKNTDIGQKLISINKNFFGIEGWKEVYELHNYSIKKDRRLGNLFDIFSQGSIDAIKHKKREIYAVMFHPEVRQKDLIRNFVMML
ncbi:hypothetical protein HYT26_00195 [Candidatus Pacearchaeota archaeon]|nr:hypothetical protein [Candidatus Pacearchaeota archaeon]